MMLIILYICFSTEVGFDHTRICRSLWIHHSKYVWSRVLDESSSVCVQGYYTKKKRKNLFFMPVVSDVLKINSFMTSITCSSHFLTSLFLSLSISLTYTHALAHLHAAHKLHRYIVQLRSARGSSGQLQVLLSLPQLSALPKLQQLVSNQSLSPSPHAGFSCRKLYRHH